MAQDYKALMSVLGDMADFPKGVCPLMSRMQIVMMPAPSRSVDVDPRAMNVVQREAFLGAPCIGHMCALWTGRACGLGVNVLRAKTK